MLKNKGEAVSRSQMLAWINRTLNINQTRVENLGSGVVYCLLLNHYFPGVIPNNKIIMFPRNHNDYRTNLRRLQEGLAAQELRSISFDVFKVAEMTYAENWTLVCKLHKQLQGMEKDKSTEHPKENKEMWWPNKVEVKSQQTFPTVCGSIMNTSMMMMNPMSTPVKGSKFLEEGKSRWQSMSLIEEIKRIVAVEGTTDRIKVGQLRRLLGLQDEQGHESQPELRDLLSDYKKKHEVIQID